jgi:hypothetical protein
MNTNINSYPVYFIDEISKKSLPVTGIILGLALGESSKRIFLYEGSDELPEFSEHKGSRNYFPIRITLICEESGDPMIFNDIFPTIHIGFFTISPKESGVNTLVRQNDTYDIDPKRIIIDVKLLLNNPDGSPGIRADQVINFFSLNGKVYLYSSETWKSKSWKY